MTINNSPLHKELKEFYSNIRDILQSFPPEFDVKTEQVPQIEIIEYDKKITITYGSIEDLQKKLGKMLDKIQEGDYD